MKAIKKFNKLARKYTLNKGNIHTFSLHNLYDGQLPIFIFISQSRHNMNGRSQMQGGKNRICRKRDECKPVLLRLSLAGNLEKPLMSLYGTECGLMEGAWLWTVEKVVNKCDVLMPQHFIKPRLIDSLSNFNFDNIDRFSLTISIRVNMDNLCKSFGLEINFVFFNSLSKNFLKNHW
jgi:hypothetical protein